MSEITPATPDENALRLASLMAYFYEAVNAVRPGARFVMTVEDDKMMLAFTDHGGSLTSSAVAIGDGPPLTPTNRAWWTPPKPETWRSTINVRAGMGSHESPPVIFCPGPGGARSLDAGQREVERLLLGGGS